MRDATLDTGTLTIRGTYYIYYIGDQRLVKGQYASRESPLYTTAGEPIKYHGAHDVANRLCIYNFYHFKTMVAHYFHFTAYSVVLYV